MYAIENMADTPATEKMAENRVQTMQRVGLQLSSICITTRHLLTPIDAVSSQHRNALEHQNHLSNRSQAIAFRVRNLVDAVTQSFNNVIYIYLTIRCMRLLPLDHQ